MNWLFLTQPPDEPAINPYALAARSKEFAADNLRRADEELRRAGARVEDAEEKNDEDDFHGGQVIARAEENLAGAEGRLQHAKRKLKWELYDNWKTKFPRTAEVVNRTKALLLKINWDKLRPQL